jgi:hypothetical protein
VSNRPDETVARLEAIRAIGEFEQSKANELVDADRNLLNRLRSKKWSSNLGAAWLQMRPHFKSANDGQRVIGFVVRAMRHATTASAQQRELKQKLKKVQKLQVVLRTLQRHVAENSFPGILGQELRKHLGASLSGLEKKFEADTHLTQTQIGMITRNPRSIPAQRIMFAVHMIWTMRLAFRKPCAAAVAHLTTIVLTKNFSSSQASDAWRDHPIPIVAFPNEPPVTNVPPRRRSIGRQPRHK